MNALLPNLLHHVYRNLSSDTFSEHLSNVCGDLARAVAENGEKNLSVNYKGISSLLTLSDRRTSR